MELFGTWTVYICGGLIVLVFGGLGLYLIIHAQRSKRKAMQSHSWPVTKGIITEANIKTKEDEEYGTTYIPIVRYTYDVDGMGYEGKRIAFGSDMAFGIRKKAVEYLAAYPVDAEVSVYYNPEKPNEAVLQQVAQRTAVGIVIGIILLVVSCCFMSLMATGIFRLITGAA